MSKEENVLVPVGTNGDYKRYDIVPAGVVNASMGENVTSEYGSDTIFDEDDGSSGGHYKTVTVGSKQVRYVPYGIDDQLPFRLHQLIGCNMVTARCQLYNIGAMYGQGVRFIDRKTGKDTDDKEIRSFCLRNSLHEQFLEQSTDMMYHYFSVSTLELCRDGSRIVKVRHKEACYCRFTRAKSGRIKHVLYGNFRLSVPQNVEAYPLLDLIDPLGDLMVRMGREIDPELGRKRNEKEVSKSRIFAVVSRMPTPGYQYYPIPYYTSIFRDCWYDIYRLIGLGKRYMIKNTSAPRIQIEIHKDYMQHLCDEEGIVDEVKRRERIKREYQNIVDFVCGPENAGKALITHYYVDPNGKENRMVRVINLNEGNRKEGGDWADDMQEAANTLCFAMGVHPNLIGATPGKSQMNNSGSDKRELATLKQTQMTPYREILAKPYHVLLHYNGWADRFTVDVPIMQLTTLDENKDAKKVSTRPQGETSGYLRSKGYY